MSSNNTAIPNAMTIFVKKKMKKYSLPIAIISILINVFLIYFFMFRGETLKASDGRTAIVMTEGNRDFALSEMRGFLETLQQINEGVLTNDAQKIIDAANTSGTGVAETAPKGLMKSLPIGFKTLGMNTHKLFDKLAEATAKNYDKKQVQQQVNTILNNCITCHRTYRLTTSTK